jgi:hypothetical protein
MIITFVVLLDKGLFYFVSLHSTEAGVSLNLGVLFVATCLCLLIMKFSPAVSWVNWLNGEKTNVS